MKIFFDSEFTGLQQDTSLISIGLVADNGDKFYAEFTDYNKDQVDDWIKENVIDNLLGEDGRPDWLYPDWFFCGYKDFIKGKLNEWINRFDTVEFVSDVAHYDFVLLIDLLYGHGLNAPYERVCMACHDINQDIARYYDVPAIKAFDMSRESILEEAGITIEGSKHNAFYDAEVIKAIYNFINKGERHIESNRNS